MSLVINHLNASVGETALLKDFSLTVPKGEVHALMGPNGTGKSSLAKILARHSDYTIESGEALLDGQALLDMEPEEAARAGLFLAFQYPLAIQGVSIANFIRAALTARLPKEARFDAKAFYQKLYAAMDQLKIERSFTSRAVNDSFSGGEKKRCEILQMLLLEPTFCILDETDSGLDIDALKIVAQGVNSLRSPDRGFLVITHYQRLLDYIVPDRVHVMQKGQIVQSGDKDLALQLEQHGYQMA